MSEPNTEDLTQRPVGQSTATDVGGVTGTQPDANESNTPQQPAPPAETPPVYSGVGDDGEGKSIDVGSPGQPVGDKAPSLPGLQNELCPNCHTGVLYVINYDPGARHEEAQGDALPAGRESGGGYEVQCAKCTFSESRAFNPGKLWGSGR